MSKEPPDKRPKLNKNDADLWKAMMRDVKPMPGATFIEASEEKEKQTQTVREQIIIPKVEQPKSVSQSKEIDRRTFDKLRKGKLDIESTLDLHGMSQSEAHSALNRFIVSAHNNGKRCVLVITGKGRVSQGGGVLRQKVPHWLHEGKLGKIVLQETPAHAKDGGAGALYVYLRRNRNT